tara:strand:- start:1568 stop:1945 length:378 start_codon:yes stop_codon:yes gene_type:complete
LWLYFVGGNVKIILVERVGESCVSLGDGLKLYDDLIKRLKEKERVDIDFEGVVRVYTPFLNGLLGRLFDYFDKEYILSHVSFCRISRKDLKKVNEFIDDINRRDTDRVLRETLEEFYEEDSILDA